MEHNCLITLKKLTYQFKLSLVWLFLPALFVERNEIFRKGFAKKLLQYSAEGKTIFYQEDTNLNLFARRSRGRAAIGEKAELLLTSKELSTPLVTSTKFNPSMQDASCLET